MVLILHFNIRANIPLTHYFCLTKNVNGEKYVLG
jgi:hypothetical protein